MGTCGTVLRGVRTAAHRGIGPGYWPTEVGAARAGCHCVAGAPGQNCAISREGAVCPGAPAAALWCWLTGACLADRADTYPYRVMQVR